MKQGEFLILTGAIVLVLAFGFAACLSPTGGGPQAPITPVETVTPAPTSVPTEPEPEPTEPAASVLEIVGPAANLSLTMAELMELPATEGYAGIKSSTGKITPPLPFKGVALKDLAALVGGMDEVTGFNVVAEDGYSITYSYDQIKNGTFVAYDPATGDELKNPVELTAILAYEVDGHPLDPKQDGILRLAIVSAEMNQVTDGHWSVKWVNKLEELEFDEAKGEVYSPLPFCLPLREDNPQPSLPAEDALSNSPEKSGKFFRVPKVIEGR